MPRAADLHGRRHHGPAACAGQSRPPRPALPTVPPIAAACDRPPLLLCGGHRFGISASAATPSAAPSSRIITTQSARRSAARGRRWSACTSAPRPASAPCPPGRWRGQFLLRPETRQRLQAELCAPLGGRVGTRIWPNSPHTAGSTGTELSTRGCSSRIEGKPNFRHGAPNLHHAFYVNEIRKNSHLGALSSEL